MTNKQEVVEDNDCMRLQRFLARSGVASRRQSEEIILAGRVSINGAIVLELGTKINPYADLVRVDNKPVTLPCSHVVLMLNKPASYLSSMSDPHGRPCVCDLVDIAQYPGIFPVGRLDFDTEGLLLFTNDGMLAQEIIHPKYEITKVYRAIVKGRVNPAIAKSFEEGIQLEDGMSAPARVKIVRCGSRLYSSKEKALECKTREEEIHTSELLISIHEGKKRQVKRMCLACGHEVMYLERLQIGALELGDLPRGSLRELTWDEISLLFCSTT